MDGGKKSIVAVKAMYIKLMPSGGHEFIIEIEHCTNIMKNKAMLSGPGLFAKNETNGVNFRKVYIYIP